jgi:hypothetical protein
MTKLYTYNDIMQGYTDLVKHYLNNGYYLYYDGDTGMYANRVYLTNNGKDVIAVRIETEYHDLLEAHKLQVVTYKKASDRNVCSDRADKVLFEEKLYNFKKTKFFTDEEGYKAVKKKIRKRQEAYNESREFSKIRTLNKYNSDLILSICQKQNGFRRLKAEDIRWVEYEYIYKRYAIRTTKGTIYIDKRGVKTCK